MQQQGDSPARRAYRLPDEGILGGVAAGLALHLRLPVTWVRVGLIVLTALSGFGALLYAGLWLTLSPGRTEVAGAPGLDAATRQGRRGGPGRRLADHASLVAVGAVALGVLLLVGVLTHTALAVVPMLLALAGLALLWRQADEAQRQRWAGGRLGSTRAVLGGGGRAAGIRVVLGLVLLVGAIMLFSLRSGSIALALNVGVAAALGILGIGLMVGPWLLRLSADLSAEREARVRSEERADVAAHLHDSVLQTLALIQRSAGDAAAVSRLARSQERDLRRWLFEPDESRPSTVAAALREAAGEVEDAHGTQVEVVCVGDAPVTERLRPLLLAAREAMGNAARHSGAAIVDVYAECGPGETQVFVRDRGVGFDPERVPADRHGIRSSILDRLHRHGGAAVVRSAPGQGTEIRLRMPTGTEETQPVQQAEQTGPRP